MKNFLKQLLASRLYRAGACMLLGVLFTALSNISGLEFMEVVALVPIAYVLWIVLLFMAYAWVINPIRELKERRKNKGK
jgi:hypothetical protein